MTMTIASMDDLLRQLREHPEWRDALRRELASEDMLALPGIMRELAEAQKRTEQNLAALTERVDALTARMDSLTARVEELAEAQKRTEQNLAALTERVDDLAAKLAALTARVDDLATKLAALTERVDDLATKLAALTERVDDLATKLAALTERVDALTAQVQALVAHVEVIEHYVDHFRGSELESRYRNHAGSFLGPLLRRTRVLPDHELSALVDDALDAGQLTLEESNDLVRVDLVAQGKRVEDRSEVYLVAEVSTTIDPKDVRRADHRARILGRIVQKPVIAVVGGYKVTDEARELAKALGVTVLLDGSAQDEE